MQLFYTNNFLDDRTAILTETEWRHCAQVLRHQVGDTIHFVDGKGGYYKGIIETAAKKQGTIHIQEYVQDWKIRDYNVHIAISPTKNIGRIEWVLEKMVEIGLDRISFLTCKRSIRKVVKRERLEKIAISAMKQSLQARLPQIDSLISFKDFVESQSSSQMKLICHLNETSTSVFENYITGKDVNILIGPEGDFTEDEISFASENGFKMIHLGQNRLRTETAAFVACQSVHFLNEIK